MLLVCCVSVSQVAGSVSLQWLQGPQKKNKLNSSCTFLFSIDLCSWGYVVSLDSGCVFGWLYSSFNYHFKQLDAKDCISTDTG